MRKTFKLQDLDCANCAAKMETDIAKLEGVEGASISFMTSKLMLEADEARFDDIVQEAQAIVSRYEPDCRILVPTV